MIFRLSPEVLEDRLFPVPFHVIPVLNLTMTNRIVDTVSRGLRVCECLIADEEIEVFDSSL
jgi:hypothetical protein